LDAAGHEGLHVIPFVDRAPAGACYVG
jgi:hypothetical protein